MGGWERGEEGDDVGGEIEDPRINLLHCPKTVSYEYIGLIFW